MNIKTAYSSKKTPEAAVQDLHAQLGDFKAAMVIYFASPLFDPEELSHGMQDAFPSAQTFGCSTSGEIVSGKLLKESVVAMALNEQIVPEVKVEVVPGVSNGLDVGPAFNAFGTHYGESVHTLDPGEYVGIILVDGLRGAEEKLMDRIGDLTNVTFIGGSAGDDLKFSTTYVYAGGKAYTDAAVLALLKPATGFDIIKTQSFVELDRHLTVTKANEAAREVIEFNSKPAFEAYAEALGVPPDQAGTFFMRNPVGLMIDGEPYVRSPQQVSEDGGMIFYCNILEGMDLSLLESTDIVRDTRDAIESKRKELGTISGLLNFNCILRTLDLESKGQTEPYGRVFSDIPTVGFSTYGEEYLGHINQTATMLVFK